VHVVRPIFETAHRHLMPDLQYPQVEPSAIITTRISARLNQRIQEPRMKKTVLAAAIALLATSLAGNAPAYAQTQNPSASRGSFLEIDGAKLYYEECGASPHTVVLVHDGVLHSAAWDDIWPEFCKDFHAIRYDRRGFGRSAAATHAYSPTDDLAALLRHLNVKRAAIVGSSHGGEISINFTLDHPDMVEQLVLVGAVVGGMPFTKHFLDRGSALGKPLEEGDIPGAIAAAVKDKYLTAPGSDAARKQMAEILTANPQDLTHSDRELPVKPALPRLSEVHIPTLLLVGDADIPDVHAHAGAIEAGIPGSRRIVITDAGHLMYLEKPAEFSRIIIQFLENQ
jgi:3-oxoadipate enol-lactonase